MSNKETKSAVSEDIIESNMVGRLSVDQVVFLSNNEHAYQEFKEKNSDEAHKMLLLSLTNEKFNETEASHLWLSIQHHRESMRKALSRDVGIAVAALDYMTNIHEILDDPILIEEDKSQNITDIATNDRLTGLVTRDIFDIFLKKELSMTNRKNKNVSLALLDIDDFKKVNDDFGHQIGDKVLTAVGEIIKGNVRKMDTAARYGGEELVILMPETNASTATKVAERIRKDIEEYKTEGVNVTVSVGISETKNKHDTADALVKRADDALYKAKATGKNKVVWNE